MRLFKRGGIYYVEIKHNVRRSLKTENKREAQMLFNEIKRQQTLGNLIDLEKKKDSPTLSEFLKLYISHPDRRLLSDQTHRADGVAFKALIDAVGNVEIGKIDSQSISKLKSICLSRNLSEHSINAYLRHIRAALNFALQNDFVANEVKIKLIKTKDELARIIYPEDLDKILVESEKANPEMHRIIIFALYTGCRRIEIINARYEHIHNGSIMIYGKGGRQRIVPLVRQSKELLEDKSKGKIFRYEHESTISNYFRKIIRACGVRARFHDLRHTAATQMLRSGISLEIVQKIMGHTDIKTTQIYAKVLEDVLTSEMGKLSY